ncbi:MAG: ABC transporter ATP-binding protein [Solirubrobacterales bacterium]
MCADVLEEIARTAPAQQAPEGTLPVSLRGVSHEYRGGEGAVPALGPIDLDLAAGEFLTIVGPSGCGKTTLLQLLGGFLAPSSGAVLVGGEPVDGPSPQRGVVFQQPNLFPWYTVRDNVALGLRYAGVPKAERLAIADEQLKLVGLDDFAKAKTYELSGGMQQRAQIARVLASGPELLLLDEPFGALDALTRERLQSELHRIWFETRRTAVFITHSVDEAVYLGTRVIVLSHRPGQIVFDARPPFDEGLRRRTIRSSTEFAAFRQRVVRAIGAQLESAYE